MLQGAWIEIPPPLLSEAGVFHAGTVRHALRWLA
jgi:hypothetical protein